MQYNDPRVAKAREISIKEIVDRLKIANLKRVGDEMVGPCPECGGNKRFNVNVETHVFLCRSCDAKGGGINLVMHVLACDFPNALLWMVGKREVAPDPAVVAERKKKSEANKKKQEAEGARRRNRAINDARSLWGNCQPAQGTIVHDYLSCRGIKSNMLPDIPESIMFHPSLPYMAKGDDGRWQEIHKGPAMVAVIQDANSRVVGMHRTWIDLDMANGKLAIQHNGQMMVAKKIIGSKRLGAIRFDKIKGKSTLVMGEGIETTLTAKVARFYENAAYWCGIDLGHMSGRRITRGKGNKYAGIPDLTDAHAWVPPATIDRLIFIQDGDSEPKLTRAKLLSGLRRAMAVAGIEQCKIVHAGEGVDLNDVLNDGDAE